MANVWEVMDALSLMTNVDESEKESVMGICQLSLNEILSRIRPDADLADPRITSAAAGQSFYMLCVKRSATETSTNMSGFKAGDLSISYDTVSPASQTELAEKIRDKALQELTPLLSDNGFFFGKVDI